MNTEEKVILDAIIEGTKDLYDKLDTLAERLPPTDWNKVLDAVDSWGFERGLAYCPFCGAERSY